MSFASLFKTHAVALTEAAKQFHSFDDMAAEDEYIHSDSLNVKKKSTTDTATRRTSDVLDSLIILKQETPLRCANEILDSLISMDESKEPHRRPSDSERLNKTSYDFSGLYQEDSNGGDSIIEKGRSKKEDHQPKEKNSDIGSSSQESGSTTKSTSRFMDDLEHRLSKPNIDMESGLPEPVEPSKAVDDSRWGWIKDAAKSRMNELIGRKADEERVSFRSPLSRTVIRPEPTREEEFNVVQSSSVFRAEDQAELDRIRLGAQGDHLTYALNVLKQHPQFAFIAFTLVLGSAVYFYSRHRTEDDVA